MVQWLRMQVLGMEVPGSNPAKVFLNIFCTPFLPRGECSIRLSQSCEFTLLGFYFITLSLYFYCYSNYQKALLR